VSIATLISVIVRVLVFVAIGVALRVFGALRREDSRALNAVIVYVALPALIFRTVVAAPLSTELIRAAAVAWAVSIVGLFFAAEIAHAMRLPRKTAAAFVIVAALGNTGYLGYPLVVALLGSRWLPEAVFYDVFGTVAVLFTLGIAVAARYGEHEGPLNVARELLTFPAVIAMLVALAYRFVPWPAAVSTTVSSWTGLAANVAVPLIMVSLGVSLDLSALKGSWRPLAAVCGMKLLVLPAAAIGIAFVVGDRQGMPLLALQAGMPSLMLSLVVGQRFKLDVGYIAAAILVTTIGCVVTIPLVQLLVR
jgi:predicted permease